MEKNKGGRPPNPPVLLKYLLNNIDKGVLPSKEELDDIQTEIGEKHLAAINGALLDYIEDNVVGKKIVQQRASSELTVEFVDPATQAPQQPQQPQQPKKQMADPNRAMNPGDLGRKRVIGNARG